MPTDLALEFIEVIVCGSPNNLLPHLGQHPILETANVDVFAAPGALAGAKEEVALVFLDPFHAHFTSGALFDFRVHILQLALILKEREVAGLTHFLDLVGLHFDHRVFHSAQLNALADPQDVPLLIPIWGLNTLHNQIGVVLPYLIAHTPLGHHLL